MDLRTDDILLSSRQSYLTSVNKPKKETEGKREAKAASWERGHDWLKSVQKDCFLWPCAAISWPVIISSVWLGRCAEHAVIWRALLHAGCADKWSRAATESHWGLTAAERKTHRCGAVATEASYMLALLALAPSFGNRCLPSSSFHLLTYMDTHSSKDPYWIKPYSPQPNVKHHKYMSRPTLKLNPTAILTLKYSPNSQTGFKKN